MAGPAPKTRDWSARENAHKPKGLHVIVFGQVQVRATNMEPRLTETAERNPRNLGLNLAIEKSEQASADVMCWKEAHFHKEVAANQFDNVIIRWDVGQVGQCPVVDDREHTQQAAAAMVALNQRYAKRAEPAPKKAGPKKAVRKKASPKKGSKKKTASKQVGGWAKGRSAKKASNKATKKKAAKKAARKAAKAAKKSGLKKLVRKLVKKLTPGKKKRR
jgi:hypothetical protein